MYFFDKKLQFTYPQASLKVAQATGETLYLQKRTSSTSKHEILNFFLSLCVIFALLDPDPDPATPINADPDQHWFLVLICSCVLCWTFYTIHGGQEPRRNSVIVPALQATYRLAEMIPWNRFQGSLKFKNMVSGLHSVFFIQNCLATWSSKTISKFTM